MHKTNNRKLFPMLRRAPRTNLKGNGSRKSFVYCPTPLTRISQIDVGATVYMYDTPTKHNAFCKVSTGYRYGEQYAVRWTDLAET